MNASRGPARAWIRDFHAAEDAPCQLVCFPHAGGSASYYFAMSRALSPQVRVRAVQYPGRQDRRHEPFFADVDDAADHIAAELEEQLDRPTALFGHSMGATIAFEVARRLDKAGQGPDLLFASGRRAPGQVRDEGIHRGTDQQLIDEMRLLGASGLHLLDDPDVRAVVMPPVRSDYRAAETYQYQPGPNLTCPIVALTGDHDPRAEVSSMEAWAEYTTGRFEIHVFPGGHFFLDRSTRVFDLVRQRMSVLVR